MDTMQAGLEILVTFIAIDGIITPAELKSIKSYLEKYYGKELLNFSFPEEIKRMSFDELQERFEKAANYLLKVGTHQNREDIFRFMYQSKKRKNNLCAAEIWMIKTLEHFWGFCYDNIINGNKYKKIQ